MGFKGLSLFGRQVFTKQQEETSFDFYCAAASASFRLGKQRKGGGGSNQYVHEGSGNYVPECSEDRGGSGQPMFITAVLHYTKALQCAPSETMEIKVLLARAHCHQ